MDYAATWEPKAARGVMRRKVNPFDGTVTLGWRGGNVAMVVRAATVMLLELHKREVPTRRSDLYTRNRRGQTSL